MERISFQNRYTAIPGLILMPEIKEKRYKAAVTRRIPESLQQIAISKRYGVCKDLTIIDKDTLCVIIYLYFYALIAGYEEKEVFENYVSYVKTRYKL